VGKALMSHPGPAAANRGKRSALPAQFVF
jgi:hypothetical protein